MKHFKDTVHPKMKSQSLSNHSHGNQNCFKSIKDFLELHNKTAQLNFLKEIKKLGTCFSFLLVFVIIVQVAKSSNSQTSFEKDIIIPFIPFM